MGLKHFSGAAAGHIPSTGTISAMKVLGKDANLEQAMTLANRIGHGLSHGHVDPVAAAIEVKAAAAIRAEPGGGLAPKGDEAVPYKYDALKNEVMFGGGGPSGPSGP